MKRICIFCAIFTCVFLLNGCSKSIYSKDLIEQRQDIISSVVTPQPLSFTTKPQKTFLNKKIPDNFSKQKGGIAFNGQILSEYDSLYGSMGPISLLKTCDTLGIDISAQEDVKGRDISERYCPNWLPHKLYIENDKVKVTIERSESFEEHFEKVPYPNIPYEVYKDGELVENI